jgi:hypothetical protein
MRYSKIEQAITEYLSKPQPPRKVADALVGQGFVKIVISDGIWGMIDDGRLEVTRDRKLAVKQV